LRNAEDGVDSISASGTVWNLEPARLQREAVMNVKTVMAVALACGGVALLGGCAGMSKKGDSSAYLNTGISDDVDVAYIMQVNDEASRHFAKVVWVNPPQKVVAKQAPRD
jgi:hypothetical protein